MKSLKNTIRYGFRKNFGKETNKGVIRGRSLQCNGFIGPQKEYQFEFDNIPIIPSQYEYPVTEYYYEFGNMLDITGFKNLGKMKS